jgi:Zn-dependent protease
VNAAQLVQLIAVYALPLVFAFALHEAGHAFAAHYLGDPTPARVGRLTLNPVKHLDLMGSVVFPLVGLLSTSGLAGGPYLLGYAKPTPSSTRNFRHPRRDSILVSAAGPAANLLQALVWAVIGIGLVGAGVDERFFLAMAKAGVQLNLVLTAFNLFPLPPLDGGHILRELLPWKASQALARAEPFGLFIVLALALTGILTTLWMAPLLGAGYALLSFVTAPLALLVQ